MPAIYAEIQVGDPIPPLTRCPSAVQLFRFSAVTWNAHRIHYDRAYAQSEGYPDILVQAHLHGAFLAQMLEHWVHPHDRIAELEWSNRRFAVVGEPLTCRGVVTARYERNGDGYIECDILEENAKGEVVVTGKATLVFPSAAGRR